MTAPRHSPLYDQVLQMIVVWGRRWQMNLALEKIQVMLVSRRRCPLATHIPTILLDGRALPLKASISILSVEMNSALMFTGHVKSIASKGAWKLEGISSRLPGNPHLICSSSLPPHRICPSHLAVLPSYLGLLDKIQHRAQYLICLKALPDQSSLHTAPIKASWCGSINYKTHKHCAPHLTALCQPWAQPYGHITRGAATGDDQLVAPFAKTFLCSFHARSPWVLNHLIQQTGLHRTTPLYILKSAINAWIKQPLCK